MTRGALRIYLGAAPGVGKTYAMLGEGVRRVERGADVVVGVAETHGRQLTADRLEGLELVPRKSVEHRDTVLSEMDVDAILTRRPDVVLVDEFAHTNAPGSRNEKRWQDVDEILNAGIDVISTLNIQHLASLNDVVTRITGTVQRETVPDAIVRRADQIELVDMAPEAIRRRMAHGNIYPPERIDAALSNFFRPGNLGALRELALLWVADRVEESLSTYVVAHGINGAWETRERVVVGLTGAPGGDMLIRRAARMAGRVGGELIGVHVVSDDGLSHHIDEDLLAQRDLVMALGGTVHDVVGHDPAAALVGFATSERATQLVIGSTQRNRWHELWHGSFVARVTRLANGLDIHVIARPESQRRSTTHGRQPVIRAEIDTHRTVVAWILAVVGLPSLTAALDAMSNRLELSTTLLLFLTLVLAVAAIGGRIVAAFAAVSASLLVNWYFVEPRNTLTIADGENVVAMVVFLAVAVTVGSFVDLAARRSIEAHRARAEAAILARSAASLVADLDPVPSVLEQIRRTFGLTSARLTSLDGPTPSTLAESGDTTPGGKVVHVDIRPRSDGVRRRLDVEGGALTADDHRVIRILADQLANAIDTQSLAREAAEATTLAGVDAVRTALLRAVSHDLRSPLATIKAMVSGLLEDDVSWTPDQLNEALETIDEETDRLNRLVGNLLDASRLQIGALAVHLTPTSLVDTTNAAVQNLGREANRVEIDVPEDLPFAHADSVLLERALANLLTNACRHSPAASPIRVTAGRVGDRLNLCVIDRGPGIPASDRGRVLAPFQRLGDTNTIDGVGLGLSIVQGFIEAMSGQFTMDDTPGGGLTVTLSLQVADNCERR